MASICACLSLHFLAHAQRVSARGLRPRPGRWTPGIFSGVLSLVPAAALINAVEDVPRRVLAIPALLPLLQIPLTVAAIKGYRLLAGERSGWRTLAAGVGTATLCFLSGLALTAISVTHSPIAAADSIALAAIREIGQCAETYRTDHPAPSVTHRRYSRWGPRVRVVSTLGWRRDQSEDIFSST